ncbi:RNA polymerase sigma factor [Chryseobacterium tructae]|uniref:RNA polymerase sigma factor n=1 Tax=Chryseobacterium tructae TaxID=1037380 RepID=A0ABV7XVK3_9FLAO|nr:RNA polymerase sigma factor [Chryseobacterium tructae]MDN3691957.1 RNA polymerase sigma factor [Chryseobacterium tructae]
MIVKTNDWQKIYSTHSPKLLGICRRYIQDLYTAEDILQDSFIAAIQNIHQLKDEKMLFAWLKKIVVNNALQHLRKSNKETFITDELPEIPETSLAMSNHEEKDYVLAYDFTQEELLSSIDILPHHHKSVFNLYCIENYSHAEIAKELGITVNTSKSHLLRAKKAVQNHLLNKIQAGTPRNRKKLTQLLIFLGFGSLLWAQTFRSKFSDFSIPTSKILEIPEQSFSQNYTIPKGIGFITKKMAMIIVGSTLCLITFASVLMFRPIDNSIYRNYVKPEKAGTVEEAIQAKVEAEDFKNTISNTDQHHDKNNIGTEKSLIPEEKTSHIKAKGHLITIKDTAQEDLPRKVIVVKKIIQRETIYVER